MVCRNGVVLSQYNLCISFHVAPPEARAINYLYSSDVGFFPKKEMTLRHTPRKNSVIGVEAVPILAELMSGATSATAEIHVNSNTVHDDNMSSFFMVCLPLRSVTFGLCGRFKLIRCGATVVPICNYLIYNIFIAEKFPLHSKSVKLTDSADDSYYKNIHFGVLACHNRNSSNIGHLFYHVSGNGLLCFTG